MFKSSMSKIVNSATVIFVEKLVNIKLNTQSVPHLLTTQSTHFIHLIGPRKSIDTVVGTRSANHFIPSQTVRLSKQDQCITSFQTMITKITQ